MNRKAIEQKDHVKYLGVLMDEHLSWKHQITNISKKISRGVGILAKLRSFLNPKLLKSIYYCVVYSHLSYGVEAWGSACSSYLEKILILQKKAVRILSGNKYFQIYGESVESLPHSEPLFKSLEILKFEDIFRINLAKFVYQTLSKESPEVFSEWFQYSHLIHSHATTSAVNIISENYFDVGIAESTRTLFTKRPHLVNYGAKMIQVSGPVLWNSIPNNVQDSPSVENFKEKLKKHFLEQYCC